MFKKLITILLAGCILTVAAGCGQKEKAEKNNVPVLTWVTFGEKQSDMDKVLEEANKIIEPAIGAKLNLQLIDSSAYTERMKMYMASGNEFDICFTSTWMNDYHKAAQEGGILDITDYIEKYAPALKSALPDYVFDSAKIGGKIYGVPNMQVMTHPIAVNAQKEYVKKYNFDFSSVKSMNDLDPFLGEIKANEPDKYAIKPGNIDYWILPKWEFVIEDSNVVILKDGSSNKLEIQFNTNEFKDGLEKTHEWYEKGYIRPDISSVGDDTTDVSNGKYIVNCGNWKPGAESYDKIPKIYAILHEPYLKRNGALSTVLSVGAKSRNPEKAVQLIELINTNKDLYNLICFGIKGTHYNLIDGKVEKLKDVGYAPNCDWAFGNQFNAYVAVNQDDDVWEQTKKMNDEAQRSPLLGFVPDLAPIQNELSQISAVNEEFSVYKVGADAPENYWNNYMEKLKIAGQQKVLDELQKQVDKFLAAK